MRHRHDLPQLRSDQLFMTDGGLETTLIFHDALELPCFASFVVLEHEAGRAALRAYYERYLDVAQRHGVGFVVDTPTWRANPDWGRALGYTPEALDAINEEAVAFAEGVRAAGDAVGVAPIVVSGAIGPRGDGYSPHAIMTPAEAQAYHHRQLATFAGAGADMATAYTLNYVEEAVGVVRAGVAAGLPVAISFTVETDGRLPTGQELADAIDQVDAETDAAAVYFMINCAHPTHFAGALERDGRWLDRIHGIRANASAKSHAELDESVELDAGDPAELGSQYRDLRDRLRHVNLLGGCCGTDHRHVEQICAAWSS